MRTTLTIALAAAVLTVPTVAASTAASTRTAAKKVIVANRSFTGGLGQADRWGNVQVTIVVRKTTTTSGSTKTTKRQIASIKVPVYPNHTNRSVYISNNALPALVQEALKAQSAHIYIISGATYTSDAFAGSLQDAITKEKAW
jgi:uncharacterized protein with FMN-binding domain